MIPDPNTSGERGDGARVRVRLLLFGAAREAAGGAESHALEVAAPATAAGVFEEALARFPPLRRFGRSLLVAVNEEYAAPDAEVREGDEVAIFPPVSGGAGDEGGADEQPTHAHDFFELTTEPIDVGEVARRVVPAECGATVTLDGYVREWTKGRRTLHLVYEAYAPMALKELGRLCREAHERFDIAHVGVVHRTGRLEIGETSVVISVSAPHRRAAFEACEWAIRELKRTVPVWKKEFFADGEVWVEGEGAPTQPPGGVVNEPAPETLS
ncbi:MAG: molybdenum cofactor biosynthesis protein MoaE [Acidobacteria bacterium]|nr:molybdenum cofactor biosynthesis protein MoaE [Acidobacteriota bacterium]MCA1642002.1 molybdenum cofactor biosynthesis protein MoaE [Acidobacteriota bacterium]